MGSIYFLTLSSSDGVDSSDFGDVESSIEFGGMAIDTNTISWRGIGSVKIPLSGSHVFHFLVKLVAKDVVRLPSVLGGLETSSHESVSGVHSVVFSQYRSSSNATCCVGSDLNLVEVH